LEEEIKKLDLGRIYEILDQGAVVVAISDHKLDLREVDQITDQNMSSMLLGEEVL
jgi:hypothetical protein